MARYRLTAPHFITNRLGTAMHLEAGTVIDDFDLPSHWRPTPAMQPLDDEAKRAHAAVLYEATAGGTRADITGFGHLRNLPRGSDYLAHAEAPGGGWLKRARLRSRYWRVTAAFSYTSKSGVARVVDPKSSDFIPDSQASMADAPDSWRAAARGWRAGPGFILDLDDAYWDFPDDFEPPPGCLIRVKGTP